MNNSNFTSRKEHSNKNLNVYSSKLIAVLLFSISAFFMFISWSTTMSFFENYFFNRLYFLVSIALFLFIMLLSLLLFFRRKPLLTLTPHQIIIYSVFYRERRIDFSEIESFTTLNIYQKGIVANRYILIKMKNSSEKDNKIQEHKKTSIFKKSRRNAMFSIHTDLLNIKQKVLLRILEQRIASLQ